MDMRGRQRSIFGPFGLGMVRLHLGQTSVRALELRTDDAVAKYAGLIRRAALVKDDATRREIIDWIGNGKLPGSPSDRFRFVQEDLAAGTSWDEIRTKHLDDLEAINAELETRVLIGEKSGVIGAAGPISLVDDLGKLTPVGVSLVVIASLGLLVVPLTLR